MYIVIPGHTKDRVTNSTTSDSSKHQTLFKRQVVVDTKASTAIALLYLVLWLVGVGLSVLYCRRRSAARLGRSSMPWRGERRQGKQRERPESDKENSGTGEALEEGHPSGSSRPEYKLKANRGNPWVYGFGLQTSGDSHYPGNTRPSFTVSDPNIIIPRPLSRIEEDSKSHGTATSAGGGGGRHSTGFGSYSKQTGAVVAVAAAAAAPMASIRAVETGEEFDGYSEGHPKQISVALDDEYSDVNRSPPGSPQSGSGARAY